MMGMMKLGREYLRLESDWKLKHKLRNPKSRAGEKTNRRSLKPNWHIMILLSKIFCSVGSKLIILVGDFYLDYLFRNCLSHSNMQLNIN